ncbi:c-type cytochrome [Colwellia demingiae]|uniref:c-type cytochrome n=1 Tax=Colwellia demingiae TaxID=89401 RepID=UPI001B85D56F|nr:c-type cytochrome [Colwellia demingiae]
MNKSHKQFLLIVLTSIITFSSSADNQISGAPLWSTPERGVAIDSTDKIYSSNPMLFEVIASTKRYSQQQIDDKFSAPDWFPNQHEKMPAIVQYGKAPKVWACASCHLTSGSGHPESATLAGLDSQYIQAQMYAFADGSRLDYSGHMNRMAKELTNSEIEEISDWFSNLTPRNVTTVIETSQVLKTYIDDTRMILV